MSKKPNTCQFVHIVFDILNTKSNKRNVTSFGKIGNRAKPTAGVKSPSVWKTSAPIKKVTFTEKRRSVAVTTRLQKRAG